MQWNHRVTVCQTVDSLFKDYGGLLVVRRRPPTGGHCTCLLSHWRIAWLASSRHAVLRPSASERGCSHGSVGSAPARLHMASVMGKSRAPKLLLLRRVPQQLQQLPLAGRGSDDALLLLQWWSRGRRALAAALSATLAATAALSSVLRPVARAYARAVLVAPARRPRGQRHRVGHRLSPMPLVRLERGPPWSLHSLQVDQRAPHPVLLRVWRRHVHAALATADAALAPTAATSSKPAADAPISAAAPSGRHTPALAHAPPPAAPALAAHAAVARARSSSASLATRAAVGALPALAAAARHGSGAQCERRPLVGRRCRRDERRPHRTHCP